MRNLEILTHFQGAVSQLASDETVIKVCVDEFSHNLFVLTSKLNLLRFAYGGKSNGKESDNLANFQFVSTCAIWENEPETSKIIDLQFVQELQGVVIVFETGSMFQFNADGNTVDEVGTITDGIIAASWSPNQEYFAVASCAGKLIIFSPDFEVNLEANIDDGDMTFHDKKQGEPRDESIAEAVISWREDSLTFVINYSINGGRKCLTRDVQKNLLVVKGPARADYQVVFSVSEKPIPSLELPICMMPNGSLVTGFQRRILPNGKISPEIVFWERNGLRHGEFVMPKADKDDETRVHGLSYNIDSSLLAVHCTLDGQEQLQIYSRSNWKWYCKQIVFMQANTHGLVTLLWHKKYQLLLAFVSGFIEFLEFQPAYNTSNTTCNHASVKELAYTAVVDGPTIHLTPLGKFMMPPPMSEKQVVLPSFAQCISMFGHKVAAYSEFKSELYTFDCEAGQTSLKTFKLPHQGKITSIYNFNHQDMVYIVAVESLETNDQVTLFKLLTDSVQSLMTYQSYAKIQRLALGSSIHHSGFFNDTQASENTPYTDTVQQIGAGSMQLMSFGNDIETDQTSFIIQMTDRSLRKLTIDLSDPSTFDETELFSHQHLCVKIQTALVSNKEVVVSLTSNLRLYINNVLFSNECTAFALTQNFLAFVNSSTGLSHLLYIYDLNRKLPQSIGPDQPPKLASLDDTGNFNVRAIERGSKIVTFYGFKAVLQMPRGNLEGIQPRILLLKEVIEMIRQAQYGQAFRLLRQHKLDINLIYDVDPDQFISKIGQFVTQVKQVDYLNLFINSLSNTERGSELEFMSPQREEDLIEKRHAVFMQQFQADGQGKQTGKINKICDALRAELERINNQNFYMLPILTTYIKKDPQELKQVLSLIQKMQRDEHELNLTSRVIPPHLNPVTMKKDIDTNSIKLGSKEALEYVSWLVNPNRLFDVALTTYDFELVTLVATQTQKDPKEYVPYLQELKSFKNAEYMKYKVHYDLKDFSTALQMIAQSPEPVHFEEALQLVKKQRLYHQALIAFAESGPERLGRVKQLFGQYLEERSFYNEAGLMFMSSNSLEQAQNAFAKALNPQMFLAALNQRGLEQEQVQKHTQELVERLVTAGMNEAAGDLLDPKADFKEALECYLRGNCFEKALKLCYEADSSRLETHVRPALLVAIDIKRNQIQGILDTFGKRMLRLKVLQHNKRVMPVSAFGADRNFELDSENLSVSNASESQMSASGRSLKSGSGYSETSKQSRRQNNAKKKMKKKRTVKEGSPFEEEYLIELLQDDTKCSENDKDQVRLLMKALVFFGMVTEANMLHGLIARVMRAQMESECLLSVEQEKALEQTPELRQTLFPIHLGRVSKEEKLKKALDEWEASRCFKH